MKGGFLRSPSSSVKSSSKSVMRAIVALLSSRPWPSNSACKKWPVSGAVEIIDAVPQSCTIRTGHQRMQCIAPHHSVVSDGWPLFALALCSAVRPCPSNSASRKRPVSGAEGIIDAVP